jgi:hypothetical protein
MDAKISSGDKFDKHQHLKSTCVVEGINEWKIKIICRYKMSLLNVLNIGKLGWLLYADK